MKRNTDLDPNADAFLSDLMADTVSREFREETLTKTLSLARRRRWVRRSVRGAAGAALGGILIALIWSPRRDQPLPLHPPLASPAPAEMAKSPEVIEGTTIRLLSDEELFALFPGRPLAMIGPPGQERLVFLDEVP